MRRHSQANAGHEDNLIAEASSLLPDEYCRLATHALVYLILGVVGEESRRGRRVKFDPFAHMSVLDETFRSLMHCYVLRPLRTKEA